MNPNFDALKKWAHTFKYDIGYALKHNDEEKAFQVLDTAVAKFLEYKSHFWVSDLEYNEVVNTLCTFLGCYEDVFDIVCVRARF